MVERLNLCFFRKINPLVERYDIKSSKSNDRGVLMVVVLGWENGDVWRGVERGGGRGLIG